MPIVWLVSILFLWASGELVARLLRLRVRDPIVALAMRFALGMSIWPVAILAASKLGVPVSIGAMRALVAATIVAGAIVAIVRLRQLRRSRLRPAVPLVVTFAVLAALAIASRVQHIRGLAFPPWVDGVHHAMIVRLLLEQGLVPATADPYIAGAPLFYHFGFHVPAAFVAAATGATRHSDLPPFLLHYGQALNALSIVAVYAAGRVLLRSREGGLLAAALAMFVSYYPAFYLSWGRSTHLAGTLVLPPLLIALWRVARARRSGAWLIAAAILASGLVLIHVRVALFALLFAIVMLVASRPFAMRTLLRWSLAALLALLFASPWLAGLARTPRLGDVVVPSTTRALPMALLASTHNRELLALATAGVSGLAGWMAMPAAGRLLSALWWIAVFFAARRAATRRWRPWPALRLLAGWLLLAAIALWWRPPGFDLTRFASLDSAVITLFLPLSLAGAALVVWVLSRLLPRLRGAALFALIVAVAIGGAVRTRDVVNPATVFTDASDLRALRWIEQNAPRDALFAVEARPWMPPSYAGVDGGYWLHVATGRRSILPPLLYAWSLPRPRVEEINATLANWSSRNPDWRAVRAAGITHIYVGARGSEEKRRALLSTNRVKLLHRDGEALVFEIR